MTENTFQNLLFMRLSKHELTHSDMLVYHVPNGGLRDKITAKVLRWLGVREGVSDLHIIGNGKMLFVELKRNAKESQSDEQMRFEAKVISNGMRYMLFHGEMDIDSVEREIMDYLYGSA